MGARQAVGGIIAPLGVTPKSSVVMAIVTRNILYRKPVDFASQLPIELVFHILSFLPAPDLKTIRLVNRLLAHIGQKNVFWSELCREKWLEKLCLQTLPMPSPPTPEATSDDELDPLSEDMPVTRSLESHLLSMQKFENHTDDELMPYSLYDLAYYFPAFHYLEGSWMRAYNLVNQRIEVSYLYAQVREDPYTVCDTPWEFCFSRTARSGEPHCMIHAFVDYRRDYKLYIVKGHRYWDQQFIWTPSPDGTAIRVQDFPRQKLGRNSDGYRTMTNRWDVCLKVIRAFATNLIVEMMAAQTDKGVVERDIGRISQPGDALLKWIDAYSRSAEDKRAYWLGAEKKIVSMNLTDADTSDEDDDGDFTEEEGDEE